MVVVDDGGCAGGASADGDGAGSDQNGTRFQCGK